MNRLMVPPAPGTQDGDWVWDGTRWVCDPDCGPPASTQPPSILQPGGVLPPFFPPPVTQPPWYPGANGGVSFSGPGSPPPNPIRGAFWFDGTNLWLFDGAAWTGVGGKTATSGGAGASTGTTPPQNPQVGAMWWDGNALLIWDGLKWDVAGGATATGSTAPSNPQPGTQWFNGTTLYIWDGNAWVPTSQTHTFIQPTAPPAPNPGDQWWDGAQMRIWDGHAWETVGPGGSLGPVPTTTISFSIAVPTAPSVAGGVWTPMSFTSVPLVDTMSAWNPVNFRYTPTKPGVYFAQWRLPIAIPTAGGWAGLVILKNDTGNFDTSSTVVGLQANGFGNRQSISEYLETSGMVQMNGTTDFLRAWLYQAAVGDAGPSGSSPAFSVAALP